MKFDYSLFLLQPIASASYFLLGIAVLTSWLKSRQAWIFFFLIAVILALYSQIISFKACLWILLFWIFAFLYKTKRDISLVNWVAGTGIVIWCLLAKLHWLQGFNNWKILSEIKLSDDAIPYNLYLNFDSTIIGLFLIGHNIIPTLNSYRKLPILIKKIWKSSVLGILILTTLSLLLGLLKIDTKFPSFFYIWFLTNLISTCIAEEALFRGFLQHKLSLIINPVLSWIIVALIFALIHFPGGKIYMMCVFVASLIYGWAYYRTNTIEAPILLHLTVNTIHFLFLTYPFLQSAY